MNNLCVLPDFRHQGIGDELLSDAFQRDREFRYSKMKIGIVGETQFSEMV